MPKRLPIRDIIQGLIGSLVTALNFWFHYTIVAIAWLGIVPLTAYRIYKCLFSGSPSALFTLPIDLLSTENLFSDGFYGCCVVTCALCTFIALVWLREQIMRGGGPEWLDINADGAGLPAGVQVNPVGPLAGDVNVDNGENDLPVDVQANAHDDQPHQLDDLDENVPLLPPTLNNQNNHAAMIGQAANEDGVDEIHGAPQVPAAVGDVDRAFNEQIDQPVQPDMVNNGDDRNGPVAAPAAAAAVVAADDVDWIPGEWDRAAEELTWERILGLDGSLVFLEHVFWVVSLNTLLILIFAFCPYYIGQFILDFCDLTSFASASQFEGLVTTLSGYCVISICLVILHAFASLLHFPKTQRFLGICYVIVKVSLLILCELGVFPLVCGWWLDICSLPMLGATLQEREASFKAAPGTSMFIHWAVGIMYVFYFASIMLLLREVMRPGVLWFLQNLNDPDFNPIQEMIHLPIFGHLRRFLLSLVIAGTTVLLMIWFPVCIVLKLMPGFLPYNVSMSSTNDSPVGELSVEFLLLQLILPALLDHGHSRQWLKVLVRSWCIVASYILDIRSYLLGDVPLPEDEALLAHDEQVVQPRNEASNQPYIKPKWFALRIVSLLVFIGLSLLLGGIIMLTLPVIIGRKLISLWMGDARIHELNTAACGLYAGLISLRLFMLVASWLPRGWGAILRKLREGLLICLKNIFAGFVLLGVIPLFIGILFDVVVIVPMRVPINQTPIFYLWQDWAFGVLHAKVICGVAMMGEWRLKQVLEEVSFLSLSLLQHHSISINNLSSLSLSLSS